mmetsp:Transcript_22474/g.53085  ORF Transcript_22474/g.53085 Transcript_22474/m.53085 type:complete len:252 (-) Transcript_22474:1033-1788(-)
MPILPSQDRAQRTRACTRGPEASHTLSTTDSSSASSKTSPRPEERRGCCCSSPNARRLLSSPLSSSRSSPARCWLWMTCCWLSSMLAILPLKSLSLRSSSAHSLSTFQPTDGNRAWPHGSCRRSPRPPLQQPCSHTFSPSSSLSLSPPTPTQGSTLLEDRRPLEGLSTSRLRRSSLCCMSSSHGVLHPTMRTARAPTAPSLRPRLTRRGGRRRKREGNCWKRTRSGHCFMLSFNRGESGDCGWSFSRALGG